jgi:hypothetical protein
MLYIFELKCILFFHSKRKIQNYSPTDTAKINDRPITSRKTNIKFSPKQIIEYLQQSTKTDIDEQQVKHKLAQEYIEVCYCPTRPDGTQIVPNK